MTGGRRGPNDDPTARRTREMINRAGLQPHQYVIWNFYASIEATTKERRIWERETEGLIATMRDDLKVVLVFGNDAWLGMRDVELPKGVALITPGSGPTMSICDYCGKVFIFGTLRVGNYRFCSPNCCESGAVLKLLDLIPPADVAAFVSSFHNSNCPTCGQAGPIDAHPSYRVHSVVVYTSWQTITKIECQKCARLRQMEDLRYCLAAGWWGGWGLIITPIQIIRNLLAMKHQPMESAYRFLQVAKLDLAISLAEHLKKTRA
jgi:hypothetical protein